MTVTSAAGADVVGAVSAPPVASVRSVILRNLLGSLAVLAAVATYVVGPMALNATVISALGQPVVASDRPISIGVLPVTVVPPPGARLDWAVTDPVQSYTTFLVGGVRYRVRAIEWGGKLAGFTLLEKDWVRARPGFREVGDPDHDVPARGTVGRGGSFTLVDGVGGYVVFLADGIAVAADFWGSPAEVAAAAPAIEASIGSIAIGAAP